MSSQDTKSIPDLFGEVVGQLGHLLETEVRLAQAELSEKIDEAATGVSFVIAAGVFIIPSVVLGLIAFAIWLSQMGIAPALSYLVSAVIGGALGITLLSTGLSRLKLKRLKMKRTMEQFSQDISVARKLTQ